MDLSSHVKLLSGIPRSFYDSVRHVNCLSTRLQICGSGRFQRFNVNIGSKAWQRLVGNTHRLRYVRVNGNKYGKVIGSCVAGGYACFKFRIYTRILQ